MLGHFYERSEFVTTSAKIVLWNFLFSLLLVGCAEIPSFRSQTPDDEDGINLEAEEVKTDYLGGKITIAGTNFMVVQGVALVMNLDGTGGDPPPSIYRSRLLDDMRRRQVPKPNAILRSPDTALVLTRAYIPPVVRKGDKFDVEIRLPENSDATSLKGGWLMESYLTEQAIVPGRAPMKGHTWAKVKGPILVSAGVGDEGAPESLLKRGRVLGSGIALKERPLGVYLRSEYSSIRNARRVESRINQRFYGYSHGQRNGLASAKTNEYVRLDVQGNYKNNQARYLQVIRNIAFRETAVQERSRIERLRKKLVNPPTAAVAALRLEAIGKVAIPFLKQGLESPSLEVRFYSAEALAYLGDASGVDDLVQAVRDERAFRVYGLAALSIIDESVTYFGLRQLFNEESVETRYGAFRAYWTLNKDDPFLRGENLHDQFMLHDFPTTGEPLVHLTRSQHAEVVVFGADQRFQTPLSLTAGGAIMVNARAGDESVVVSRFEVGKPDQRRAVSTRVTDVIRAVADMGGSYPDVAQMLAQASHQHNLPGRLEVDALPQAGRFYMRPAAGSESGSGRKTSVGNSSLQPNLYPSFRDSNGKVIKEDTADQESGEDKEASVDGKGEVSVADVSSSTGKQKSTKPKRSGVLGKLFNGKDDGE